MTHSLHVLTPSLGRVSLGYRDSYALLALECARREIKLSVTDATDAGHLVHARNVLFRAGVDGGSTHCLWLDADTSFVPASVFDLLERPEAMIARPYPMRAVDLEGLAEYLLDALPFRAHEQHGVVKGVTKDEIKLASLRWTAGLLFANGRPQWSADRKLVRLRHCGFGWVLMRTDAMQRFATWSGVYQSRDWRNRAIVPAFNLLENAELAIAGEDVSFCWRWAGAGLSFGSEIWAAPDHLLANGEQAGRFADYLEAHGLGP